jgi:Winged helix DNA-binding domain
MVRALRWRDVWQARLAAQFLDRPAPADRLTDVVGAVCGIHAQVAASAELSLNLRVDGITQADVRAALWTQRSLVKTYGLRGTLHIFPTLEVPLWLAALRENAPPRGLNPIERNSLPPERLRQLVDAIRDALDGQQLTREELGVQLERRLGAWVTELAHPAFAGHMPRWQLALQPAALAGVLAFGPNRGARVTYVRLDQWLGELPEVDARAALREVCRRYVRAYGPTTHVELARWLYTTPAAARQLLLSLGDDVEEVDVEGWRAFGVANPPGAATRRTVHLLPRFDCYIVGCHPRKHLIPETAPAPLQRGTAAPFQVLLVDGVVAGLWEQQRRGSRLSMRVDPFDGLAARQYRQLESQAERMAEFYGVRVELELGHVEPRGHM